MNCVLYVQSLVLKSNDMGLGNRDGPSGPLESPHSTRDTGWTRAWEAGTENQES